MFKKVQNSQVCKFRIIILVDYFWLKDQAGKSMIFGMKKFNINILL